MKSSKVNKPKAQIAHELKQKQHFEMMKKVARENIYPVVLKHATSVKHAENTLQIFKSIITIMMQKPYRDMTIDGLKIKEEVTNDTSVEDRDFHLDLCEALKDISIGDAAKLLEGMAGSYSGISSKKAGAFPIDSITIDEIAY